MTGEVGAEDLYMDTFSLEMKSGVNKIYNSRTL